MDELEIKPLLRPLVGAVQVPGSKSITNRALLMAALANGPSRLDAALLSDDTRYMIGALQQLGFTIGVDENSRSITVEGRGGHIPSANAALFVGGSGTAMRFLAGFLTLGRGRFRLDGNARMRERPIGELIEALTSLGVTAYSEKHNGCPPITLETGDTAFAGGATTIDARRSSQFVSALLIPAPLWARGLRLTVHGAAAHSFIDMTLRLMERWGVSTSSTGDSITVPGGQSYRACHFLVEADASSASYFAALAALCGGSIRLRNLRRDSIQGDIAFLDVLERMGATLRWFDDDVVVEGSGTLHGIDIDMSTMPDMVPTLAVLAPFADSPTRIRNVGFIRHHESDRVHALATELGRLGADVEEFDDGLGIRPSPLKPRTIETYDDHRIAMSFAIAGLKVPGIRIKNPGCVSKTYPDFFIDLAALH